MSEETKYFLFLIERYAAFKDRITADILREWDEHKITQEIYDNYEMYHQERIENAFEDIDCLIKTGRHAF